MDSKDREERDAKIYARRIEGRTLKAIGLEFGLCPARVREIAMAMARQAKWREYAIGHQDGINNDESRPS
jgi:hypothetical protein